MGCQLTKNAFRGVLVFLAVFLLNPTSILAHEYGTITVDELGAILDQTDLTWEKRSDQGWVALTNDGGWIASTSGSEIGFARTHIGIEPSLESLSEWNSGTDIPEATRLNGYLLLEHYMIVKGATPKSIIETFQWFKKKADDAIEYFENSSPSS